MYKLAIRWVFFAVAMFCVISFTFTSNTQKSSPIAYIQRDCAAAAPPDSSGKTDVKSGCDKEAKTEHGRSKSMLASSDAVEFLKRLIFFKLTWSF